MILNIIDQVTSWFNKANSWVQANYDEPLLWLGMFCTIVIFMLICGGFLKEKGR